MAKGLFGGRTWGPDSSVHHFSRDLVALNRISSEVFSASWTHRLDPGFFYEVWGRFAEPDFATGFGRRTYHEPTAQVFITVRIGREILLLPDPERRLPVSELLREGAARLCPFVLKKDPSFEADLFVSLLEEVLERYLALPSPLPRTRAERKYESFPLWHPEINA